MRVPLCSADESRRGLGPLALLVGGGTQWMFGGVMLSNIVGQIGSYAQGWPIIAIVRENQLQMVGIACFMGIVFLVMTTVTVLTLMDSPKVRYPSQAELTAHEFKKLNRKKKKRSSRRRRSSSSDDSNSDN